ncbi:MAG: helicase C-terminal domain-containing protein [Candidatus Izemoplasmataceae bacterium]
MEKIRISAKDLVTFSYASGDLSNQTKLRNAQLIGTKLHMKRQATYLEDEHKEVFLETFFPYEDFEYHVSGRMDGLLKRDNTVIIEEIKSTETDLSLIEETTFPAHLMQAKIYGYIYCLNHNLKSITLWLTYIHTETEAIKTFTKRMRFDQLKKAFTESIVKYTQWQKIYQEHQFNKMKSLEGLSFPFDAFREGQYHFMGAVYQTLMKEDILYATAPTGIGKTIGAIFSGLKTLSNDKEKLFYLTAKNAGKTIAVETVETLKANGLKIKAITLNSKENMCLMDEVDCDPEICPYAKGFYNRLKGGLEDIFVHDDVYDAKLIKAYGELHTICPHEFALEISNYSDIIICDYNYVFDPRIKLIRYFEDDYYTPKLLIDEAHNLVDRSRSMYSSTITLNEIKTLLTTIEGFKPSPKRTINQLLQTMENLINTHDIIKTQFYVDEHIDPILLNQTHVLMNKLDELLQTYKKHPLRKDIRNAYFLLVQFIRISEYYTDAFRFTIETSGDDVCFNIVCFDASKPVKEIIDSRAKGTTLFSATLNPVDYYASLLTQGVGVKFEVPSPFDPSRLGLMIDVSTSTKYRDRNLSITKIIDTIYAMLEGKKGNYIVFFPSYQYMNMVLEQFDASGYTLMVQNKEMNLFEREDFLTSFKETGTDSKILFSVLGGSFSEGIDYIGDMLSGVLVVGVALPQFNVMNELLKDYYNSKGYNGFDYAYTYPGMNKVIQAVGRVIRTKEDAGIAILFDSRYQLAKYKALFPSHWKQAAFITEDDYISDSIEKFWKSIK